MLTILSLVGLAEQAAVSVGTVRCCHSRLSICSKQRQLLLYNNRKFATQGTVSKLTSADWEVLNQHIFSGATKFRAVWTNQGTPTLLSRLKLRVASP